MHSVDSKSSNLAQRDVFWYSWQQLAAFGALATSRHDDNWHWDTRTLLSVMMSEWWKQYILYLPMCHVEMRRSRSIKPLHVHDQIMRVTNVRCISVIIVHARTLTRHTMNIVLQKWNLLLNFYATSGTQNIHTRNTCIYDWCRAVFTALIRRCTPITENQWRRQTELWTFSPCMDCLRVCWPASRNWRRIKG